MAIISVLAAMLLPVLSAARDRAREVSCMSNMRQVYLMSQDFEGDEQALLPAWYYTNRPDGLENGDTGQASAYGEKRFFGHMLIDKGYFGEDARVLMNTVTTDEDFARVATYSARTPFSCPSGLVPRQGYWNTYSTQPNFVTDGNDRKRIMVLETADKLRILTGYQINMNAGSNKFYHGNASVNFGFYRQIRWQDGKAKPEEIAYVFEANEERAGGIHFQERHTIKNYNYTGAYGGGPSARHRNLSLNNLIYYDGHADHIEDLYPTAAELPYVLDP